MRFLKSIIFSVTILIAGMIIAQEHIRNVKWGMSKQEVKSSETTKLLQQKPHTLIYQDTYAGIPVYIQYVFLKNKDKLAQVRYYSAQDYNDQNAYINDFQKVSKQLTSQYGQAARDTMMWKSKKFQGQKDKYGQAVAQGDLSYLAQWVTPQTNIRAQLWGDDQGKVQMAIQYTSKKYQSFLR